MNILAITSQKGGVGKTTLSFNLGVAAAASGVPTIIFDLDPQITATKYHDRRLANGGAEQPKVVSIQAARLPNELKAAMSDGYGLAILDTPPNVTGDTLHISQAGDLILIPVQPSMLDLDAIGSTIEIAKISGRPSAAVLNSCRHQGSLTEEARNLIEGSLEFPVVPQTIGDRVAFVHAATAGQSVIEYEPEGKAASEIMTLWKWVESSIAEIKQGDTETVRSASHG